MNLESQICQLEGYNSADLQLKLQLPTDYEADYLVIMFKLRTATDVLVGPSLLLFLKITSANNVARTSEAELIVMGQALS